MGGETAAGLMREAREDDDVKAIVLRVDSPGGSVFASEQIYREVRAAQADGKPVVVSMGDLAASGGYYIASSADEIWAHPATITGSIGIFGAIPTFQNTLKKIGVNVDGVGTTNLSGQLRIDRPLGEDAKMLLQSFIERGYEEFLGARRRRPQEDPRRSARHRAGPRVDRHRRQEQWARRSARPVRPGGEVRGEVRQADRLRRRAHRARAHVGRVPGVADRVWFAQNFVGEIVGAYAVRCRWPASSSRCSASSRAGRA